MVDRMIWFVSRWEEKYDWIVDVDEQAALATVCQMEWRATLRKLRRQFAAAQF